MQRATVTSTVLRPFRDGYQDSVRVSTTSNAPAHGTLRILNPSGVSVLTVPLATGTAWATTWTGCGCPTGATTSRCC